MRHDDLVDLTPAPDPTDRRGSRPPAPRWVVRAAAVAAAVAVWVLPAVYWWDKIEQSMAGPQPVTAEQLAAAADPKALPRYVHVTPDPAAVTDTGLRRDEDWSKHHIHDKMLLIDLGGKAVLAEVPQAYQGGPF